MKPAIAIALSGGVDSLVAAHLLKKSHRPVVGIHFTTGYETDPTDISALEDQLSIPVHKVDLSHEFQTRVVDYFISTYLNGKTPNPCLMCNRQIKFKSLVDAALKLGADRIATGHYAGIRRLPDNTIALIKGRDPLKEQSYFLAMLSKQQLKQIVFPLAELTKQKVKQIAAGAGLVPDKQKESQDICFIKGKSIGEFIMEKTKITPCPGDVITSDGTRIGRHDGLFKFTIGQRRGINCPGPRPYYVKSLDVKANCLVVGFKEELDQQTILVRDLHFTAPVPTAPSRVTTKIRYSHSGALSTLSVDGTDARITFDTSQSAVTPGQAAVFYEEDRVLGAGIIQ